MDTKKNENEIRFTMRINAELYEKLKQSAKDNHRSIAKEIEFTLANWYNFDIEGSFKATLPYNLSKAIADEVNRQFEELKKEKN